MEGRIWKTKSSDYSKKIFKEQKIKNKDKHFANPNWNESWNTMFELWNLNLF